MIEISQAESRAVGSIDPEFWAQPIATQREVFLLSFLMLFASHGIFGLHGNAVAAGGSAPAAGTLIVGPSGAGKTTLAMTLVDAGFLYLSDDAFCLARGPRGDVEARALRSGFSATDTTIAAFPRVGGTAREDLGSPKDKWLLSSQDSFPGRYVECCRPVVVLFPRISQDEQSKVEPLAPASAMVELIRQSPGVLAGRDYVLDQTDLLGRLLDQASAYSLSLGQDLFDDPARVVALVRSLQRGNKAN